MTCKGHPTNPKLWIVETEWHGKIRTVFTGTIFEAARFYHEHK